MNAYTIRRGDIYYIDRFDGQYGSEQQSGRPAVIVSNNANNENSGAVEVVYLTTKPKKNLPTHVTIFSTGRESTVLCEQVTTVSIERLGAYIGRCTEKELDSISDAIIISLALADRATVHEKDNEADAAEISTNEEPIRTEIAKIAVERDTFRAMYERLLDRIVGNKAGGGAE